MGNYRTKQLPQKINISSTEEKLSLVVDIAVAFEANFARCMLLHKVGLVTQDARVVVAHPAGG